MDVDFGAQSARKSYEDFHRSDFPDRAFQVNLFLVEMNVEFGESFDNVVSRHGTEHFLVLSDFHGKRHFKGGQTIGKILELYPLLFSTFPGQTPLVFDERQVLAVGFDTKFLGDQVIAREPPRYLDQVSRMAQFVHIFLQNHRDLAHTSSLSRTHGDYQIRTQSVNKSVLAHSGNAGR